MTKDELIKEIQNNTTAPRCWSGITAAVDVYSETIIEQSKCSTLRELLAQMHTKEFNAFSHATEDDEMKKHTANMKAIQLVIELIKDFQPVA